MDARRPRRARLAAAAAALVAALTAVAWGSVPAEAGVTHGVDVAARAKPRQESATAIGTYAVGKVTKTFVDTTRPTNANNSFPGAPSRTLLTTVYYPAKGAPSAQTVENAPPEAKGGPYPLILFSHGVLARGVFYEDVLKSWVSAGYVVAAPDYPLSNTNAPGGVTFGQGVADVKNQPADASFVIGQVLKLGDASQPLAGLIDRNEIGAAGHSLGGITTYGLTFSACCADKRIGAALVMSGLASLVDQPENYFHGRAVPLLVMHGDADPLVPYQSDVDAYSHAKAPKFFLTFDGAGHIAPFLGGDGAQVSTLKQSAVDFFNRYLKNDSRMLADLERAANSVGSSKLLEQTR